MSKIILGIDPGLANSGFAVLEGSPNRMKLLTSGLIKTKADEKMEKRLQKLYDVTLDIIKTYKVNEMAIEDIFFMQDKNNKSALSVAMSRGVFYVAGANEGVSVSSYSPTQVKKGVVGSAGYADKDQVWLMVSLLLGIKEKPKTDHESDAIAIAITHYNLMLF